MITVLLLKSLRWHAAQATKHERVHPHQLAPGDQPLPLPRLSSTADALSTSNCFWFPKNIQDSFPTQCLDQRSPPLYKMASLSLPSFPTNSYFSFKIQFRHLSSKYRLTHRHTLMCVGPLHFHSPLYLPRAQHCLLPPRLASRAGFSCFCA